MIFIYYLILGIGDLHLLFNSGYWWSSFIILSDLIWWALGSTQVQNIWLEYLMIKLDPDLSTDMYTANDKYKAQRNVAIT